MPANLRQINSSTICIYHHAYILLKNIKKYSPNSGYLPLINYIEYYLSLINAGGLGWALSYLMTMNVTDLHIFPLVRMRRHPMNFSRDSVTFLPQNCGSGGA